MKNIIYLVLSSNIPFYKDLEDIVRRTWARETKRYPNNKVFFICESDSKIDVIVNDTVYVSCSGLVTATTYKFIRAMNLILLEYPDTDFFVRTNSSTWLNVDAINTFIETLNDNIQTYAGVLIQPTVPVEQLNEMSSKQSDYTDQLYGLTELHHLFLQGNSMIFSSEIAKIAVAEILPKDLYAASDDITFSRMLIGRYVRTGLSPDACMHSVGLHFSTAHSENCDDVTDEVLLSNMFVQIKTLYDEAGNFMRSANMYYMRVLDAKKFLKVHEKYQELLAREPGAHAKVVSSVLGNIDKHVMCYLDWYKKTSGAETSLHCWMMYPDVRRTKEEFRKEFPSLF